MRALKRGALAATALGLLTLAAALDWLADRMMRAAHALGRKLSGDAEG